MSRNPTAESCGGKPERRLVRAKPQETSTASAPPQPSLFQSPEQEDLFQKTKGSLEGVVGTSVVNPANPEAARAAAKSKVAALHAIADSFAEVVDWHPKEGNAEKCVREQQLQNQSLRSMVNESAQGRVKEHHGVIYTSNLNEIEEILGKDAARQHREVENEIESIRAASQRIREHLQKTMEVRPQTGQLLTAPSMRSKRSERRSAIVDAYRRAMEAELTLSKNQTEKRNATSTISKTGLQERQRRLEIQRAIEDADHPKKLAPLIWSLTETLQKQEARLLYSYLHIERLNFRMEYLRGEINHFREDISSGSIGDVRKLQEELAFFEQEREWFYGKLKTLECQTSSVDTRSQASHAQYVQLEETASKLRQSNLASRVEIQKQKRRTRALREGFGKYENMCMNLSDSLTAQTIAYEQLRAKYLDSLQPTDTSTAESAASLAAHLEQIVQVRKHYLIKNAVVLRVALERAKAGKASFVNEALKSSGAGRATEQLRGAYVELLSNGHDAITQTVTDMFTALVEDMGPFIDQELAMKWTTKDDPAIALLASRLTQPHPYALYAAAAELFKGNWSGLLEVLYQAGRAFFDGCESLSKELQDTRLREDQYLVEIEALHDRITKLLEDAENAKSTVRRLMEGGQQGVDLQAAAKQALDVLEPPPQQEAQVEVTGMNKSELLETANRFNELVIRHNELQNADHVKREHILHLEEQIRTVAQDHINLKCENDALTAELHEARAQLQEAQKAAAAGPGAKKPQDKLQKTASSVSANKAAGLSRRSSFSKMKLQVPEAEEQHAEAAAKTAKESENEVPAKADESPRKIKKSPRSHSESPRRPSKAAEATPQEAEASAPPQKKGRHTPSKSPRKQGTATAEPNLSPQAEVAAEERDTASPVELAKSLASFSTPAVHKFDVADASSQTERVELQESIAQTIRVFTLSRAANTNIVHWRDSDMQTVPEEEMNRVPARKESTDRSISPMVVNVAALGSALEEMRGYFHQLCEDVAVQSDISPRIEMAESRVGEAQPAIKHPGARRLSVCSEVQTSPVTEFLAASTQVEHQPVSPRLSQNISRRDSHARFPNLSLLASAMQMAESTFDALKERVIPKSSASMHLDTGPLATTGLVVSTVEESVVLGSGELPSPNAQPQSEKSPKAGWEDEPWADDVTLWLKQTFSKTNLKKQAAKKSKKRQYRVLKSLGVSARRESLVSVAESQLFSAEESSIHESLDVEHQNPATQHLDQRRLHRRSLADDTHLNPEHTPNVSERGGSETEEPAQLTKSATPSVKSTPKDTQIIVPEESVEPVSSPPVAAQQEALEAAWRAKFQRSRDSPRLHGNVEKETVVGRLSQVKVPYLDVDNIDFDIFDELKRSTADDVFVNVCCNVLLRYELVDTLQLNIVKLFNFIVSVRDHYSRDNPYHNAVHAADVLQTTHIFLLQNDVKGNFFDTEMLSLLIAAMIHDVGHIGVSNAFLKNIGHPLALIYNDDSPLESMHAALAFHLLSIPQNNFFAGSSACLTNPKIIEEFREQVIHIVLGTDMKHHVAIINQAREMVQDRVITDDEVPLLLRAVVHTADLSNPLKRLHIYEEWACRVTAEFWRQGDSERQRGMAISVMCDRTTAPPLPRAQLGFINFVLRPLVTVLSSMIPAKWIERLEENVRHFTEVANTFGNNLIEQHASQPWVDSWCLRVLSLPARQEKDGFAVLKTRKSVGTTACPEVAEISTCPKSPSIVELPAGPAIALRRVGSKKESRQEASSAVSNVSSSIQTDSTGQSRRHSHSQASPEINSIAQQTEDFSCPVSVQSQSAILGSPQLAGAGTTTLPKQDSSQHRPAAPSFVPRTRQLTEPQTFSPIQKPAVFPSLLADPSLPPALAFLPNQQARPLTVVEAEAQTVIGMEWFAHFEEMLCTDDVYQTGDARLQMGTDRDLNTEPPARVVQVEEKPGGDPVLEAHLRLSPQPAAPFAAHVPTPGIQLRSAASSHKGFPTSYGTKLATIVQPPSVLKTAVADQQAAAPRPISPSSSPFSKRKASGWSEMSNSVNETQQTTPPPAPLQKEMISASVQCERFVSEQLQSSPVEMVSKPVLYPPSSPPRPVTPQATPRMANQIAKAESAVKATQKVVVTDDSAPKDYRCDFTQLSLGVMQLHRSLSKLYQRVIQIFRMPFFYEEPPMASDVYYALKTSSRETPIGMTALGTFSQQALHSDRWIADRVSQFLAPKEGPELFAPRRQETLVEASHGEPMEPPRLSPRLTQLVHRTELLALLSAPPLEPWVPPSKTLRKPTGESPRVQSEEKVQSLLGDIHRAGSSHHLAATPQPNKSPRVLSRSIATPLPIGRCGSTSSGPMEHRFNRRVRIVPDLGISATIAPKVAQRFTK